MVSAPTADPSRKTRGAIHTFPTGEYYVAVGDSITAGSQDDIPADGIGYEPILENLLAASKGYPIAVVNAGVSGDTSADGAATISTTLSNNPSGKYFLIMYGTNDAGQVPPVTKSTYKNNMQTIISAVVAAGKTPYLAKVPYTTNSSYSIPSIQAYNAAIDELVVANSIMVIPPDFYTWFLSNPTQLADTVHPNGTGYKSMAGSNPNPYSWFTALTQ
jgi:acyl-CoA thioesterase-1